MPARILAAPFVVAALFFLYLAWETDGAYSVYVVPPVLALAIIYVLNPQINWWWYRRRPPQLSPPVRQLLRQHHAFYPRLTTEEKKRFRQRVALFMLANEFMPQGGMDAVPEDVKGVTAIQAVTLTFGQAEFLMTPFERIVYYPGAFPSPQYPQHFHASEIYEEDGVLLFSVEHLMRGFIHPQAHFNIGLYEYARAFIHKHDDWDWPRPGTETWEALYGISNISRSALAQWINLPEETIAALPVCIVHFFHYPEGVKKALPGLYRALRDLLRLDPLRDGVVDQGAKRS